MTFGVVGYATFQPIFTAFRMCCLTLILRHLQEQWQSESVAHSKTYRLSRLHFSFSMLANADTLAYVSDNGLNRQEWQNNLSGEF